MKNFLIIKFFFAVGILWMFVVTYEKKMKILIKNVFFTLMKLLLKKSRKSVATTILRCATMIEHILIHLKVLFLLLK